MSTRLVTRLLSSTPLATGRAVRVRVAVNGFVAAYDLTTADDTAAALDAAHQQAAAMAVAERGIPCERLKRMAAAEDGYLWAAVAARKGAPRTLDQRRRFAPTTGPQATTPPLTWSD